MDRERKTESGTTSRACEEDADRISALSDDLLVKILSFLPTKLAVSTTLLSKRWECLWMWLPKLKYDCFSDPDSEDYELKNLRRFLDLNLPLHRAQIIESFHLKIYDSFFDPRDVELWLVAVLSRHLRKLKITYYDSHGPDILPSSLYTCESLVVLKLRGFIRVDVPPLGSLPSLKTLHLIVFSYLDGESLRRFLSLCTVLENLDVYLDWGSDDLGLITVIVPSLQSLTLHMPSATQGVLDLLLLDTPSLKYLKLEDFNESSRPSLSIETMPDLEEAYVDFRYFYISGPSHTGPITSIERLLSSITSVKRLTICLHFLYGDGLVFNQLEHLKLCAYKGFSEYSYSVA